MRITTADNLAPIEGSTSILMRTAWHQSKVLLQFLRGQLGTNRKFYFNFYADSLAPIESSTSIFMRTAWHQSKVLFQFLSDHFELILSPQCEILILDFEFLMRFSDVLSQNTDPH